MECNLVEKRTLERHNADMSCILGVASNGTDSAACLFKDGELLCAVEEERFTRVRNEGGFPRHAIRWCIEFAGIDPGDIRNVAVSWDYRRYGLAEDERSSIRNFYRSLEREGYPIDWVAVERHIEKFRPEKIVSTLRSEFPELSLVPIRFHRHHDCHAASSYSFSGFDRSLVLVLDEKGEDICTSLYLGEGDRLRLMEHHKVPHSLGLYYAAATQFLKFTPFRDEGTFMALATNGEHRPTLCSWLSENVLKNTADGIVLNPEMISKEVFHYPRPQGSLYTKLMLRGLSRLEIQRPPGIETIQPIHQDFAFTIQEVLESVILKFLVTKSRTFKVDCLCISGGVGLNCILNGRIVETNHLESRIHELFLPPWCHDAGGAIGAAILTLGKGEGNGVELRLPQFGRLYRADWGPDYPDNLIERVLRNKGLPHYHSPDVAIETAQFLADGHIVAWFQGRAEFGPRALGQRSLLSHPQSTDNKQRLQDIKRRLPFRPFAPSILEEHAFRYFSRCGANTDFMATAFKATDSAHREIPDALNTSDGTLRPQTVAKRKGWLYRKLLEEFYRLTGIPAILNTSFNIHEPIVLTPNDAVSTFLRSNIDVLAIEDFIVMHPLKSRK